MFTALGAALLWFGWFGFNAGSEFGADGVAGSAFLMTNFAAAVGVVTWIVIEMLVYKKATLLGGASGAIAGLVAITPAAGFVDVTGVLALMGADKHIPKSTYKKAQQQPDCIDHSGLP